jgi:hypothetical protein
MPPAQPALPGINTMTPERKSRELIDGQLYQTGWAVQSAGEMDISAARGVAVREFPQPRQAGSRFVQRLGGHGETTSRIAIED